MEVLPLCNLQPLATQHNEFSKYLSPILSAWQLGVLYEQRHSPPHFAPLPIAVAAEGHSSPPHPLETLAFGSHLGLSLHLLL